jgi:molybdopterin molybdotransferase
MLTVSEALEAVLKRSACLPPVSRALAESLGSMLAQDVAADLDSPPFDKALVDGYAVRAADLAPADRRLTLGEEIPAGRTPSRPLRPREAALIMTGAPLPADADAVIMIERTRREGESVVVDDEAVTPDRNLLPRGREMRAGDVVLRAGEELTPVRLGLLAAVGRASVTVIPRPRVAVLSTGDELVEPDQVPGPGQIRNSNATILRGLATLAGAEAEVLPTAPDEAELLRGALRRGLNADVLLITGGVSAGNRDLVPETLDSLGVERVFHKIKLKPGKPLWFGVGPPRLGDVPGPLVFGLPGNPVSGIVGFLLFVRPALDALAGRSGTSDRSIPARLSQTFTHAGDRPTFHPARLIPTSSDGDIPVVEPLNWAGSADLRTVARADGFAEFPAGDHTYAVGEIVRFLALG